MTEKRGKKKGIVLDDSELERERERFEKMKKEYLEKLEKEKKKSKS